VSIPSGFIVWLTGPPAAGKSTLGAALVASLREGRGAVLLDADEIRHALWPELSFSRIDREANIRRMGYMARLLARNSLAVVVAAISPYEDTRQELREAARTEGVPWLLVHVAAPFDVLVARDPKGLYRRALAGDLPDFTGVSQPYELPPAPDMVVDTDREAVAAEVARVCSLLQQRGLLPDGSGKASESVSASESE
jgi:adenylylsulfate kinase